MIKQNLKRTFIGLGLASALVCAAPSQSRAQSIELMAGNRSATLDLKVSAELAPRTNLFIRNRATISHDALVSEFGLVDLSYNLPCGLGAVAEAQLVPGAKAVPRLGMQYFRRSGDLSVYGLGTISLVGDPDGEILLNLRYTSRLTGKIKGVVDLENITNVGRSGHNFSTQRIRVGANLGKYELGLAADLSQSKGSRSYNIGAYGRIRLK